MSDSSGALAGCGGDMSDNFKIRESQGSAQIGMITCGLVGPTEFDVLEPLTGELIGRVPASSPEEAGRAVAAGGWRAQPPVRARAQSDGPNDLAPGTMRPDSGSSDDEPDVDDDDGDTDDEPSPAGYSGAGGIGNPAALPRWVLGVLTLSVAAWLGYWVSSSPVWTKRIEFQDSGRSESPAPPNSPQAMGVAAGAKARRYVFQPESAAFPPRPPGSRRDLGHGVVPSTTGPRELTGRPPRGVDCSNVTEDFKEAAGCDSSQASGGAPKRVRLTIDPSKIDCSEVPEYFKESAGCDGSQAAPTTRKRTILKRKPSEIDCSEVPYTFKEAAGCK